MVQTEASGAGIGYKFSHTLLYRAEGTGQAENKKKTACEQTVDIFIYCAVRLRNVPDYEYGMTLLRLRSNDIILYRQNVKVSQIFKEYSGPQKSCLHTIAKP